MPGVRTGSWGTTLGGGLQWGGEPDCDLQTASEAGSPEAPALQTDTHSRQTQSATHRHSWVLSCRRCSLPSLQMGLLGSWPAWGTERGREREGECVRLVCMRRWHTFVHFCVYECAPVCFVGVITCMWGFVYEHVCAYFDGCPCVRTHAFVCTYKDL